MMIDYIGAQVLGFSNHIFDFFQMAGRAFTSLFRPPIRFKEFVRQLYFVANGSLFIIVFCVCFAAMVTILESSFHMKLVIQNDSMVPGFAAMLILRELGAVVTALLLTSRVGAGISAEVGLMQITEQVDALKMLGIDPIQYLVLPRFFACVIGGIALTVIADLVCIYSAMVVSETYLGFTSGMFLAAMRRFVEFKDLIYSVIKGATFGAVIPLVGCYYGFKCKPGAEGVGTSTTNSVVTSSVAIIIIDFLLSYLFSIL
jgi:phospholipid/cholesterol/gamma-HCH transport system permease protein